MHKKELKLVIIDYQLSNLFSVIHACETLGYQPIVTTNAAEVINADAILLPGVGAFKEAMDNLRSQKLDEAIYQIVEMGKPLMGVCLGLQLLFETSEEFGNWDGLGLIKGNIKKFKVDMDKNLKVPQIAWNKINQPLHKSWEATPLKSLEDGTFMYFVHSFYALASNKEDMLSQTTYGTTNYCSAILKNNIFATQFHPEKSGAAGLSIYKNWLENIIEGKSQTSSSNSSIKKTISMK